MDVEKGYRMTYFCLKYSKELSTAAMPCRHCKYGTEFMKEKSRSKYRRYQDWDTHIACNSTDRSGHLLKVASRIVLGRHCEMSVGMQRLSMFRLRLPGDAVCYKLELKLDSCRIDRDIEPSP